MRITNSISLDFGRVSNPPTVYAKQGDAKTRYIAVTPLSNGAPWNIPNGIVAHFACRKPDGKHVYLDTPVIENNIIAVELSDQTLVVAGRSVCDIILLTGDGKILSSQNFYLETEYSPGVYAELESTDEVQALHKLISNIESKLANGEFNGAPGKDGKDGTDGKDGEDGQDGPPGPEGPPGTSVTHEWNGTILTITSASGTSSADLQGSPGEDAELTETDKAELVQAVLDSLPRYNGEVVAV